MYLMVFWLSLFPQKSLINLIEINLNVSHSHTSFYLKCNNKLGGFTFETTPFVTCSAIGCKIGARKIVQL